MRVGRAVCGVGRCSVLTFGGMLLGGGNHFALLERVAAFGLRHDIDVLG